MLFLLFLFLSCISSHAGQLPITVAEEFGISCSSEYVTSGIPLSKDFNILSTDALYITNEAGQTIPAQFRILSRYHGEVTDLSKPAKALLVDFATDLSANSSSTLYLNFGGELQPLPQSIATDDTTNISIATGAISINIDKSTPQIFNEVYLDGVQLIDAGVGVSIQVTDNGNIYSSNNSTRTVSIEENGPLRCVIMLTGFFEETLGKRLVPTGGDNGLGYTTRLTAFKINLMLKVDITIKNENLGWTDASIGLLRVQHAYFDSIKVVTPFTLGGVKKYQV